jgi:hypothetical protein
MVEETQPAQSATSAERRAASHSGRDTGAGGYIQALVLLLICVACVLAERVFDPRNTYGALGLLVLGVSLLIGHLIYLPRLFTPAALLIPPGVIAALPLFVTIPATIFYGLLVCAMSAGAIIVALAARRGYVSSDPLTPGVLLLSLGLYVALEPLDFPTHDYLYDLANSLRLPAVALGDMGGALLYRTSRHRRKGRILAAHGVVSQ